MTVQDEPLNPLPVEHRPPVTEAHTPPRPRRDRFKELPWALVGGLGPFILALIIHASIAGWHPAPVDPSNLGYCLFALSLAAVIRITSHGEGRDFMPVILLCGMAQVALAMYFGRTFDHSTPSKLAVNQAQAYLNNGLKRGQESTPISTKELDKIQNLVMKIADNEHSPSITAYCALGTTGLISIAGLVRYWSPAMSRAREAR